MNIQADRFWDRMMRMAQIGATPKGGVCRVALTEDDKIGRELFIRWCEEAGCSVRIDQMGNRLIIAFMKSKGNEMGVREWAPHKNVITTAPKMQ